MLKGRIIDCAEAMVSVVKEYGIIPLFKGSVPGWSIQEMTSPGCWFTEGDNLGPWDWKVDCVQTGEVVYGKFLGGKAAFATPEWYQHLMRWRRSLDRYRLGSLASSGKDTAAERLTDMLAPGVMRAIRESGAMEAREIRLYCSQLLTKAQIESLGASYQKLLSPAVKKTVVDSLMTYLQMGTWSVVGDIKRVYRGPQLSYNGWQRASNTTPEAAFGLYVDDTSIAHETAPQHSSTSPSWARRFEEQDDCIEGDGTLTPEQSREALISHILELFPGTSLKDLHKTF